MLAPVHALPATLRRSPGAGLATACSPYKASTPRFLFSSAKNRQPRGKHLPTSVRNQLKADYSVFWALSAMPLSGVSGTSLSLNDSVRFKTIRFFVTRFRPNRLTRLYMRFQEVFNLHSSFPLQYAASPPLAAHVVMHLRYTNEYHPFQPATQHSLTSCDTPPCILHGHSAQ